MNADADPVEIAAPSDPALYARRRVMGPGVWAWLLLCLVCVGLGAAFAWFGPSWFAAKPTVPEAPVSATPSPSPIAERVTAGTALALESPEPVAPVPAQAEVERLNGRITALEASQKSVADAAVAALAVATLAEAAGTSRPFGPELLALERVLPGSPDLRALEPLSRTGAPTRAGLATQFGNLAGRAASAARNPGVEADLFSRIRYALSSIVSIRYVGSTKGSTPDAMLARAQALLDEGDVEGAVAALDPLNDSSRDVLAPWFVAANRRIEIDRHVSAVRTDALAELARVSRATTPVAP
jgi:hypothetical protein